LAVSATVLKILTLKARKWLISHHSLIRFLCSGEGDPLEFIDETYPTKIRGMGTRYGENFMILFLTVFA